MFLGLSRTAFAVVLCAASTIGVAQTSPPAAPAEPSVPAEAQIPIPPPAPTHIKLPALSGVSLKVLEEMSSKTAVPGHAVRLALASPLYLAPELGLPAGTPVEGVVIHAAKGGMGGKSGELLIGAKRIFLSPTAEIPLRSFKLGPAKGQNNEALAMGATIAGGAIGGVAAMFITGGSARVPADAIANAKTSAEVDIPIALLSALPLVPALSVTPASVAQASPNQPPSTPASAQGEIE